MKSLRLLVAGLFFFPATMARSQLTPEKTMATFSVSDPKLEISLWASEPLFVNPTCIDIDHRGRVWVCESVNYRHRLLHRPPHRPAGDRILILEDTRGTGKANKVSTFYQSPDTLAPLGIAVAKDPKGPGYKVFVCQSPDILVFEDKDGDGKADGPPKKLLSGFGGFDHDHGVHGILIGPDGKLYFSIGDQGVSGLVDKNGKKWTTNQTDCQAGTVWRCDLDGSNLEQIAHNFRNEYEPCVDSFGTVFVSDNDDDGNQQTRICYVMPGGNYGYWPRGLGQSHWHEEQPGIVPKILRTYFGSPTGICVYEGELLAPGYQGQLLHTDAGPRQVRCYHLTSEGAAYAVDRQDLVNSTDNWFRPSDVCVAPDGSVYVADWYDPGVGGHGMGDTNRGRVYRIAPRGVKPSVPIVDLNNQGGIIKALASPALSVRYMAMAKLQTMDHAAAETLLTNAANQDDQIWLRARALWQLGRLAQNEKKTGKDAPGYSSLLKASEDKDPRFRVLALRIFKDFHGIFPGFIDYAKDPSAMVRREALLALRDVNIAEAKPLIWDLAESYDGKDRFYLEAIGIAVGQNPARRNSILEGFERRFPQWDDRLAGLIWELRPPQALPVLSQRLTDPKLSSQQKMKIADTIAGFEPPSAGDALLRILRQPVPNEIRDRVVEHLKSSLAGKWRDLRQTPELDKTIEVLLEKGETRGAALVLIGASEKTNVVPRIVAIVRDPKEPSALKIKAVETLGFLPVPETITALRQVIEGGSVDLRAMAVQSLGRVGTPGAITVLEHLVTTSSEVSLRQSAAVALAGTRNGSAWLLDLEAKKDLPELIKPDVARMLRNSPYQDLRKRALSAFPPPGRLNPKKLPGAMALLARKGDIVRGKQLITASIKSDMQCLRCHTIRGVGGKIGPDLSVIGKKASRENLIESILFPSKAIADQYLTWSVETKTGLVVTGLIVEETAEAITLRDANGKDTRISKTTIEGRAKSPNSLMPNDLLVYMTEDDVVDIVEYLFTLKTPVLSFDYWRILGPFDNGTGDAGMDRVFPPERSLDFGASYAAKIGKVSWNSVKSDDKGYVDLQAYFGAESSNIVSYLYRELESPAEQEALAFVGTDDCGKLWINGKLVYQNMQHRAAAPDQDSVRIRLKKGRNSLLLKINNGDGAHGFFLTLQADHELKPVTEK